MSKKRKRIANVRFNESVIGRRDLVKQTGKTDKRGKRIFYILMFPIVIKTCHTRQRRKNNYQFFENAQPN